MRATFKTVDTCAAEFAARTPYHYSTYEDTDEVAASQKQKVVILGSGRTASARVWSSIIAVCRRVLPSTTPASRR